MNINSVSHLWIIVGLGNPGDKYAATRHNAGFMVLDRLAAEHRIPFSVKEDYAFGKGSIENNPVILLKPLTYMNLSGTCVRKVLKKSNMLNDDKFGNIIVVHDDLDLEPGIVKIRRGGSSGGHKGIESIINSIGTREFIRIKIGIGRDRTMPVEEYVLRRFKPAEKKPVEDAIIKAVNVVQSIIADGLEKAMNSYNRTAKKAEPANPGA